MNRAQRRALRYNKPLPVDTWSLDKRYIDVKFAQKLDIDNLKKRKGNGKVLPKVP